MAQQPSTMSTPAVVIRQGIQDQVSQVKGRPGVVSANPPSTNMPASVKLESSAPPPIPSTGSVPFMNPMETPRTAEANRVVNDTPPTMSVNLREDFISEASAGHTPLSPNLISTGGTGQERTSGRPGSANAHLTGTNPIGTDPIIPPTPPAVTPPIVAPADPGQGQFE